MFKKTLRMSKLLARLLTPSLAAASIMISAAYAVDQGTTQPHPVHRKAHKKAPPPLVLPPLPPGPLQQLPMADLPASTPKVTYENGLLTIGAQNATLGDVLREVHKLTGANIDVPPTGANERVVVQLGPGAPRDVLAALLNGTSFNYVLLGSATDAKAVATVTLSPRPSTGGGEIQTAVNTPAATPIFQQQMQQQAPMPSRPFFRGQNPPQPAAAASDDDSSDDDADDKDDSDDSGQAQPQQPGQMVQPGQQPDGSQDPNGTPNAGPRTPEQILQMIRDRQQPGAMGVPPGQQQPPQD